MTSALAEVHQLRASLDHIVSALAQPHTTEPKVLRKIDFPIYVDEALFDKRFHLTPPE